MAGALAATMLNIPVGHAEASLRSFDKSMQEEINRVLVDHVSDLLFCPTSSSIRNLEREGIKNGVYLVGDVMFDLLKSKVKLIKRISSEVMEKYGLSKGSVFWLRFIELKMPIILGDYMAYWML